MMPSSATTVRLATEHDAAGILAVYAAYLDTPITFETVLPPLEEFRTRVADICATYPYLVAEREGEIVGYAYASAQHPRAAYAWNVELSVYLASDARGRGLGRALYETLLELVRAQGAKAAYALVTMPNEASERLHAALGFERIGLQPHAGWKTGGWHDVAWLRKELSPYEGEPEPLVPFPLLVREQPDAVGAVIDRANANLRG